jgi:hypothetical protein
MTPRRYLLIGDAIRLVEIHPRPFRERGAKVSEIVDTIDDLPGSWLAIGPDGRLCDPQGRLPVGLACQAQLALEVLPRLLRTLEAAAWQMSDEGHAWLQRMREGVQDASETAR